MHGPANSSGSSSAGMVILTSIGAWTASIVIGVPVTLFMLYLLGIPLQLPSIPRSPSVSRLPSPTYTSPSPLRTRPRPETQPSVRFPSLVPSPPPVSSRPPSSNSGTSFNTPIGPAPAVSTDLSTLRPEDRVMVKWGSSWYPATITGTDVNAKIGIHYDNHDNSWDEQVTSDRVRVMDASEISRYGTRDPAKLRMERNSSAPLQHNLRPGNLSPAAEPMLLSSELRTWHGPDGQALFKAKLARAFERGAILRSEEGLSIVIRLDALSAADQAYVNSQRVLAGTP